MYYGFYVFLVPTTRTTTTRKHESFVNRLTYRCKPVKTTLNSISMYPPTPTPMGKPRYIPTPLTLRSDGVEMLMMSRYRCRPAYFWLMTLITLMTDVCCCFPDLPPWTSGSFYSWPFTVLSFCLPSLSSLALGLLEALKNIKMSLANKVQDQSQYPFRPATNSILFALLWYLAF